MNRIFVFAGRRHSIIMSPAIFIFLWSNCGEYLSSHESGQKKQNGAQNRFEFAPYLFLLP